MAQSGKPQTASKSPRVLTKTLHSRLHDRFVVMIREMRIAAKLSQTEAAERLGVRQSFISDIERGERRVDVVELIKLCRVYKGNIEKLIKDLSRLDHED